MSEINKIPFRPVKGLEKNISDLIGRDGYIYYATDSRKTYLGTADGEKLLMGYDTGIFYGKKEIPKKDDGKPQETTVYFNLDKDIEGNRLPQVNDLILNVDGCFYRVESMRGSKEVQTKRLTLQGTGGGGSTDPSGPGVGYSWYMFFSSSKAAYSTEADKLVLPFETSYVGSVDNHIIKAQLYWGEYLNLDEEQPFFTATENINGNTIQLGTSEAIDITSCKSLFNTTDRTVTLALTDYHGVRHSASIQIRLVELSLTATENTLIPVNGSSFTFSCDLNGANTGNRSKRLVYTFYRHGDNKIVHSIPNVLELPNTTGNIDYELNVSSLSHGSYKMTVQAFVQVDGMSGEIASNIITHQIGCVKNTNSPILLTLAPEQTEQYTDIPIDYLYVTSSEQADYTLEIRIDNAFYKNLMIKANEPGSHSFYFDDAKLDKKIVFTVVQTGISSTEVLNLTKYTGDLPIINKNDLNLMLYLNPKGKTNNDLDRGVWKDAKTGSNLQGVLNNVSYSSVDGWLVDEKTGEYYLKLISGATFDVLDFRPFYQDLVYGQNSNTKVQGLTIELDFEINGVVDPTKPIISCISKSDRGAMNVGLEVTGSALKFYNHRLNGIVANEREKAAFSNQTIAEGQRVKASIVIQQNNDTIDWPMAYTYLNGKLTEAVILDRDDKFSDVKNPAYFTIDSRYAQIKIYGIRFYKRALSSSDILRNYTATLPTKELRQAEFDSNNVYSGENISYDLVSAENYNLEIPYMVLTGGYPSKTNIDKKCLWTVDEGEPRLPTGKKDYRFVDVKVVYPKTGIFANYENYLYENKFSNEKWMSENIGNKPTNGGAVMYCQGTSSMEYPIKNLRLRWKNSDNYFAVKPDLEPVEIICMKADYMESSGSHNTGAANLIDDIYDAAGMRTPAQEHNWDDEADAWKNGKRTVTCIKGYPCLIFYSPSGETGTYEYIGKYNLNLDKATPEPFGFLHDEETNFGYLKDEEGKLVLDGEGNKQNSIFCYEFLDNTLPVCNFLTTNTPDIYGSIPTNYHDTWYNTFYHDQDDENYPGWRMGFESRYPDGATEDHDADVLYPFASWVNELYLLREQEEAQGKKPGNITYQYQYTLASEYKPFTAYFIKNEADEYEPVDIYDKNDFNPALHYTRKIVSSTFEMQSLQRFHDEYWKYLDKDFTLSYYLITEALMMVDSRVKNMMIATWGREWRYRLADGTITKDKPSKGQKVDDTPSGDNYNAYFGYIFYPIFYDMDTMLGLNNEGRLRFNYYDEDTDHTNYNGDDVLWNLVRDSLSRSLTQQFSALENGKMNANSIIPYFNDNQANLANEAFYNGDAMYKYVNPARFGYQDLLKDKWIEAGKAPYLYALQGDRMLHRQNFINNRMKYLSGKYVSDAFLDGDHISFRWNTPTDVAIPPSSEFNFTGLKTGYAGVQLGQNGSITVQKFYPGQEAKIVVPRTGGATEAFILGVSTLSDLGDLSDKYMGKFAISSPNNRLERVQLGNPHKDYYNINWADGTENIDVNSPTLKEFNLQNCSSYRRSIDFTNNPIISTILMTGSGVSSVTFPENGVITELRLPNTISTFTIKGHKQLTNDNFSMGTYHYGEDKLIGGVGGEYVNDFSNIQYLTVIDTPIDTYAIVDGSPDLISYNLQNIDWTITTDPYRYCYRDKNWTYIDENGEKTTLGEKVPDGYYIFENNGYVPYTSSTYPSQPLYEKVSMFETRGEGSNEKEWITCIPVLEHLLTLNTNYGAIPHKDALSGTITIAVPNANVVELEIYDRYKNLYPNVTIQYDKTVVNVKEAYKINFYSGANDNDAVTARGGIEGLMPAKIALTAEGADYSLSDLIDSYKPVKIATPENIFKFTGKWVDWAVSGDTKPIYYQKIEDDDEEFEIPEGAVAFSHEPTANMDLVPVFESRPHKYSIILDAGFGSDPVVAQIAYGEDIGDFFDTNLAEHPDYITAFYNYKAYDDEAHSDKRWSFKGWKLSPTEEQVIPYLKGQKVTGETTFYAHYVEENVYSNATMVASPDDYFDFDNGTISIKDKFRGVLQGKITLPATDNQGRSLTTVGNFSAQNTNDRSVVKEMWYTHIYFEENPNATGYTTISDKAFSHGGANSQISNPVKLKKIYLPASLTSIGNESFAKCNALEEVHMHNGIKSIGLSAFWQAGNINSFGENIAKGSLPSSLEVLNVSSLYKAGTIEITQLPVGVSQLPTYCLSALPGANITQFGSENSPIKIESNALNGAGNGSITNIIIYCNNKNDIARYTETYTLATEYNSIQTYYVRNEDTYTKISITEEAFERDKYYTRTTTTSAFNEYNTANLESLTIYGPAGIDFTDVCGSWGLKITKDTTVTQPNQRL